MMFIKTNEITVVCTNNDIHIDTSSCIYHFVFLNLCPEFTDFDSEEENSDIGIGDVLLWAIVFNRRELAEICWQRGKDHLCKQNEEIKINYYYYFNFLCLK